MKSTFGPKQRLEREYAQAIGKVTKRILTPKRPDQTFDEWVQEIAANSRKKDVEDAAEFIARQMVNRVNVGNVRTWREAAAKHGRSRQLHRLLSKELEGATGRRVRELVAINAAYITSIPLEQATRLNAEITKAQQAGARAGTIAKMARTRFPELLNSRVQLIARTETAKASTVLTQARCEDLNIDFYEWLTSDDVRVRPSHKKMNGVIVPWSQAPNPERLAGEDSTLGNYHSGECPNCRCSQRVILTIDDIVFPARVYWQGSIHRMTKQQFKQIAVGLESRAA